MAERAEWVAMGSVNSFRILGPVEVLADGSPVAFGRAQQRDLLVLLLLNANRLLTVDEVIEAMWGGAAPSTALAQVRNMASALRAVLTRSTPGLATLDGRGGYRLRLDERTLDLAVFEDLAGRGRAAGDPELLRSALALWRGQPLTGVRAAYAGAARARLEEQRLVTVAELYDAELARGRHAAVIPELTKESGAHPLSERLAGLLMTALYRSSRQAEALDVYRRLRQRLVDEHGLEPGPALRELELLVLRGDRALADPEAGATVPAAAEPAGLAAAVPAVPAVPAMLPRAPTRLIGREQDADRFAELLAGQGGPVIVTGMAGVGKTALALHAAHAVAGRFPDGQLFVDLRGFDPTGRWLTPYDALGQLLIALGVPYRQLPASLDERSGRYRSLLAGTRTLVVLDNARSSTQVRPLIPGDEASAVVVTSRNRLDGLLATAGGRALSLDVLSAGAGRELLASIAGPARVAAEPAAAAELAARCGQLPLALCIVAARLCAAPAPPTQPSQPVGGLVASIDQSATGLAELSVDDDTSVLAVFDASVGCLPAPAQRLFLLLGQHPGPTFTPLATAALHGAELPAVRRLLGRLAQDHLVIEGGADRYRMHDLLAKYARERAAEWLDRADLDAALHRLLDYYVAATLAADRVIDPGRTLIPVSPGHDGPLPDFGDTAAALSWLDEHYPMLLGLMRLAEEIGSRRHVWQLPYALGSFFLARGRAEDFVASHERAQRAVAGEDWRPLVAIANNLGTAYHMMGRYPDALRNLQLALDRCRQEGDAEHVAMALGNLGKLYEDSGDHQLAIEYSEQSIRLMRQLGGNPRNSAVINLASMYRRAGRHQDARSLIESLLRLCAEQPDARTETYALRVLGESYGDTGETAMAVDCYLRAASTAERAGYLAQEATAQYRLGAYLLASDPARAADCLRRALDLYTRTGRPEAAEVASLLEQAEAAGQSDPASGAAGPRCGSNARPGGPRGASPTDEATPRRAAGAV